MHKDMALENLVDGMTGLQMANTIKNNFEKVLDAESAENKAENAGKSIKTDYDATRYIELQLADGTPVKMKMDVFCQAIAPVVAGQMLMKTYSVRLGVGETFTFEGKYSLCCVTGTNVASTFLCFLQGSTVKEIAKHGVLSISPAEDWGYFTITNGHASNAVTIKVSLLSFN